VALFGNKEEKAAQDAAARAEVDRLLALPVPELAEAIMPAFGPEGARPGEEVNILLVMNWLMRSYPRGTKLLTELRDPTWEAMQALENAGLLIHYGAGGPGARLKATRAGEEALADGTVAEQLR
jgi:hypothetical protein